jgi:hypothetical protein
VFSQLLFSPEPVALLRRAESAVLEDMGDGLELTARALERDDERLAEQALSSMRDLRDRLAEVSRMRRASRRVVRHSLAWRMRMAPVVRERENAGHLDLLGGSCLMLTRIMLAMNAPDRRRLAPSVRELAGAVAELAEKPGNRPTRQRSADRALAIARRAAGSAPQSQAALAASVATQMVATDVMVFCGVGPEQAADAVRQDRGELHVPDPPPTSRMPFRLGR